MYSREIKDINNTAYANASMNQWCVQQKNIYPYMENILCKRPKISALACNIQTMFKIRVGSCYMSSFLKI